MKALGAARSPGRSGRHSHRTWSGLRSRPTPSPDAHRPARTRRPRPSATTPSAFPAPTASSAHCDAAAPVAAPAPRAPTAIDSQTRRHHRTIQTPGGVDPAHLIEDPTRTPSRVRALHLQHQPLHHTRQLVRTRPRPRRARREPGQPVLLVAPQPRMHRPPRHTPRPRPPHSPTDHQPPPPSLRRTSAPARSTP